MFRIPDQTKQEILMTSIPHIRSLCSIIIIWIMFQSYVWHAGTLCILFHIILFTFFSCVMCVVYAFIGAVVLNFNFELLCFCWFTSSIGLCQIAEFVYAAYVFFFSRFCFSLPKYCQFFLFICSKSSLVELEFIARTQNKVTIE